MAMHDRDLFAAGDHQLFGVGLGVFFGTHDTVADREKQQTVFFEISATEVGEIPTQFAVEDFLNFIAVLIPFFGSPGGEFRQFEAERGEKFLCFFDFSVDFRTFHFQSSFAIICS